ncbi:MAG: DUF4391 domain-containing protein [Methanobrevibacter sp.]|nr:DUF4391 domain-containing protein [Candidatus Methanovirga meridionalis]
MIFILIERILNFPEECKRKTKIFKEKIYSQSEITNKNKTLFINSIDEIRWVFALNKDNIRIFPFINEDRNYSEVEVINVILKEDKISKTIVEILLRYIPNPTILSFEHENKISLFLAHKLLNRVDKRKTTIEKIIQAKWMEVDNLDDIDKYFLKSIQIENLKASNFYNYYDKIINNIYLYNASKNVNKLLTPNINISQEELFELSEEIIGNEKLIKNYNKQLDKESYSKKIVELNRKRTKILNRQAEIEKIIS